MWYGITYLLNGLHPMNEYTDILCAQKTLLLCRHQLPLDCRTFPSLLPEWLEEGYSIYDPFRVKHSVVFYSLHLGQLWVSVLTTIYCKENFFLMRVERH